MHIKLKIISIFSTVKSVFYQFNLQSSGIEPKSVDEKTFFLPYNFIHLNGQMIF